MSRRFLTTVVVAVLAAAACGGGDGASDTTVPGDTVTTNAAVTTTEAPVTTEDAGGETVGLGDIPQECIDAFVGYLKSIEGVVEDVDWANLSMTEMEDIGTRLEPITSEFEESTAATQCEDIDIEATDQESWDYMIDLARHEAPGTVGYLEMISDLAGAAGGDAGIEVSGDCETDIAAFQAIVDQGGTAQDMTLSEMAAFGSLTSSISANCTQSRVMEFFNQEDVVNFLEG